jgi:glucosamine-phosphate N-acetyltransferase
MVEADLKNGFLQTLRALSHINDDPERVRACFFERAGTGTIHTFVLEDVDGRICATATLVTDPRFSGGFRPAGRLEDVAVRPDRQGQGLGRQIVAHALAEARRLGCYKVTLECDDDKMGFYEKLGLSGNGQSMRIDL